MGAPKVEALENPVKDPKDTAPHHPAALAGAVMEKVKTPRLVFRHLVAPVARAAPGKEKVTAVRHPVAPVTAATAKVKILREASHLLAAPGTAATEKGKGTIQQDPLEKVRDTVVHHPATEKAKVTLEIMAQVKGTQDLLEVMGKGKVMKAAVHGIRRLT